MLRCSLFRRPASFLVCVFGLLLVGLGLTSCPSTPKPTPQPDGPARLAVLVVVDQLRGDYLMTWDDLFGQDGFKRLDRDGAWFQNCHYPYAFTVTGAGHASVSTGSDPATHGIVGNKWYEPMAKSLIDCVGSTEQHGRVPPAPPEKTPDAGDESENKIPPGFFPGRLLAPTLGDALKTATNDRGKVVALSFKDRSAVLPAGQKADACVWLDGSTGTFVTSLYYGDGLPKWVADFNAEKPADRWFGLAWDRVRPDLDYAARSGPDDRPGEGKGKKQGVTFPHPTDGGEKTVGKNYYEAVYNSPYGNDLLLELVKRAVDAEQLGADDVPDLLCVSFSSNDPVGHCWGPESQEVLDMTLRTDAVLAALLAHLDEKVGKGRYIVGLTADHGVCPLPETASRDGKDAGRVSPKKLQADADAFLTERFGPNADKVKWFNAVTPPWFYLNRANLNDRDLDGDTVAEAVATWLKEQPGIMTAYTRAELANVADDDAVGQMVKRSTHADRCGDVTLVLKPYWLLSEPLATGTSHGTPHAYDTHVPLLVYGPGVEPGLRQDRVTPLALASILARGLDVAPPAKAEYGVPEGLFR
jgi:hypothetical protein